MKPSIQRRVLPVLLAAAGDSVDILHECRLGIAVRPNDKEALWAAFSDMYQNMPKILSNRDLAMKVIRSKYSRQRAAEKMEEVLVSFFLDKAE